MSETKHDRCDGGWVGNLAVLAMWTRTFIRVGLVKGIGMMLPILRDQFATETWIIGWIISLVDAVGGVSGPLAGFLSKQFGTGVIIMACGGVFGLALIAASFVTTATQLAITLILFAGISSGLSAVVVKDTVGRCFGKNLATATGISYTGGSIGMIVFPPLIQLFLSSYGWRGTMLLIGGISMHLAVCGALILRAEIPEIANYQQLPENGLLATHTENQKWSCGTFWKNVFKILQVSLLCDFRYWSMAAMVCSTLICYDMWIIYFVSQAQSKGISIGEAATIVAIAGIFSLAARVIQGFLIDRGIISPWISVVISVNICSASYFASAWLASYWTLMVSSILILFFDAALTCMLDVCTKELLGVNLLAGAYGWFGIKTATLRIIIGFLPGLIYDITGSYQAAFIIIGFIQLVPMIPLLMLKYLKYI